MSSSKLAGFSILRRRGCLCFGWLVLMFCGVASSFADDRVDDVMYQDPAFPKATIRAVFSERLKPLWLEALRRPDSELKRMAADTIALAHRSGMPGLEETADELIATFQIADVESTVRYAAARALVELDARQAAEAFAKEMNSGIVEMSAIVEPALADWDYAPAREIWRQRLDDPATQRALLLLAVKCLGTVKDDKASGSLLAMVANPNADLPVRLAAARSAAQINEIPVVDAAIELAKDSEHTSDRLLAATLLGAQASSQAVAILKRLAVDSSTVVSSVALRRLLELDPANVYEFAASAIGSSDVNVRRVGCEALVHQADAAAVALLGTVLDDVNPGLRRYVSASMVELAGKEALQDEVLRVATEVVSRDAWRGLEQAVIVLGTLDHESAAPRFFELLDHPRPEVGIAAGWGLRKLAISDRLPDMLTEAKQRAQLYKPRDGGERVAVLDSQLSQLFQAFGEMDYQESEADALMRKFIPKQTEGPTESRVAAVWALGKLKEGKLDESLARQLAGRLSDLNPENPELDPVRRMSAIAIGRMKAESQLGVLQRFVEEAPGFPGQACDWSIQRITGQKYEFSFERAVEASDWFIRPR